jgi:hypothetical protein
MKLSAISLLAVIGSAVAGKPQLSINVQDGNFADIGGLDPTVSWSDATTSGDLTIEYGIEAAAKPTSDLASLPKKVWGKASTSMSGWGVSARADFDGVDFSKADVEIDADNEDGDLSLHVEASMDGGFKVKSIEATKGFDSDGSRVTVQPRYDMETEEADVVLAYSKDDTKIEITASQSGQSVTLSKQIDDDNRVAPTLSSSGDLSVEWERSLGDGNSLTATLKPNESVDVEWKDDAWTANINVPLDGTDIKGTNVSIKREVNF